MLCGISYECVVLCEKFFDFLALIIATTIDSIEKFNWRVVFLLQGELPLKIAELWIWIWHVA